MQVAVESSLTAYSPIPRQFIIAREGFPFIAFCLTASLFIWLAGWDAGAGAMLCAAVFVAFFFRNPDRAVPSGKGLIVAPADGRIVAIDRDVVAPLTGKKSQRVSTFMSLFSVHINRFPVDARLANSMYYTGRFSIASLDKSSRRNERNVLVLEDEEGRELVVSQIAGAIARRIVCYVKEGDALRRGERFGMIRFGSRVDVYLPPEASVEVSRGDRVKAGETVIGRFS